MNKPITWMGRNHVAANLLMGFLVLSGLLALLGTKKETFPEFSLDMIQIQVPYLGASPEEVEDGVVTRIEERLSGIEDVRRITSTASEGVGVVRLELELGADVEQVLEDVKNEVDRIETFPAETEKPVVNELLRRNRVIDVVLYGDVPEKSLKVAAERVRNDLRGMDGISQVDLTGVRPDEISIEVSENSLRRYGLSLGQVTEAVRRASLDLPGGSVKNESGEILVRTKGLKYSGIEYAQIVVFAQADGTQLRLGQIATINDGFEDTDLISRFNGKPAAVVQVFRIGNQSALEVAAKVRNYIEEQTARDVLPAGIQIGYSRDDTHILNSRIDLLLRNARLGIILVFICLSLFLDLRLAFWVMMGIPISFLGSFVLMQPFDASINMLSLFAFIVALGMVVDDAIIVGENIYAHREKNKNFMRAAIDGTLEVATPVIFSILTSIAAFTPLFFVEGMMGKFMGIIPVIVVSVLLLSLIESLFILPAHLSSKGSLKVIGTISVLAFAGMFFMGGSVGPVQAVLIAGLLLGFILFHNRLTAWFSGGLKHFIENQYTRILKQSLANPAATVAVGIAILLITFGMVAGGRIKFVFMPQIESDFISVSVTMPMGTTADQTEQIVHRIERAALEVRDQYDAQADDADAPSLFRNVFGFVGAQPLAGMTAFGAGGTGSMAHIAEVSIELLPSEERDIGSEEVARRVRETLGEVPGPESLTFSSSLFSAGKAIDIQLASKDFDQLLQAVKRLKAEIAHYPGTSDIQDNFQEGKVEMKLALKDQARPLGLTLNDLARQVRQGFYGDQALRVQRGRDDVRVMIRYPQNERRSLTDIERMRLRTPAGVEVPFTEVAEVTVGRGYANIQRAEGQRVVSVSGAIDEQAANAEEINSDLRDRFLPVLVQDYPGLTYRYEGEQKERQDSFASLGRGFMIAMFAVYALLALPFRSYTQPLVVMAAIPFGIVGAVWGHIFMGLDLALLSMFGIVALSGVVVNDSLVLMSFYNQLIYAGMDRKEALVESGKQRFRAILLTSLTTFFGLLPMILEKSVQAQFLIPMAVSLGFGILFATAIILIGVPVTMSILGDVLETLGYGKKAEAEQEQEAEVEAVPAG
jgi:multidrug efflux pump subunit AcrB